jgi:hypothetical protein
MKPMLAAVVVMFSACPMEVLAQNFKCDPQVVYGIGPCAPDWNTLRPTPPPTPEQHQRSLEVMVSQHNVASDMTIAQVQRALGRPKKVIPENATPDADQRWFYDATSQAARPTIVVISKGLVERVLVEVLPPTID